MNSPLNPALIAIGIRLGGTSPLAKKKRDAFDVERVLLDMAEHIRNDGRLASLLFSWVDVHAEHIIVEKLRKLQRQCDDDDLPVAISALAAYAVAQGQHKWKKLISPSIKKEYFFKSKTAKSAVKLKGEMPELAKYGILVAKGSLRIRRQDVLSVVELAKTNQQYRNRLLFGASWRADIISAIQQGAVTATEVMQRVGCSYEPAHRIRREYLIATQG